MEHDWNVIMAKIAEILEWCSDNDFMEEYHIILDAMPNLEDTITAINEFETFKTQFESSDDR